MLPLLLAVLMALSMTACNRNNTDAPSGESPAVESVPPPQSSAPEANTELALENLTLADNDVCAFRISSVDPDGDKGYTLEVYLENKTSAPLSFSIEDASLNGYMCSPYWSAQLDAESGADMRIFWYSTDLELNGITTVRSIEFTFKACEGYGEDKEDKFTGSFEIFPYGDAVEALAADRRQPVEGEIVLVDDGDFMFSITEFDAKSAFAYAINVYLDNKSGKNVMFTLETATINGYNCNPYWAAKVPAGKRANAFVSWMEYDLDNYGIVSVDEIEFNLRVYDADDWISPPLLNQNFTVTP